MFKFNGVRDLLIVNEVDHPVQIIKFFTPLFLVCEVSFLKILMTCKCVEIYSF